MKLLTLFLTLLTFQILPQNIYVTGTVKDAQNNSSLSSANVLLYHLPDSSTTGVSTDNNGTFKIEYIKSGKYMLAVQYIGYETYNLNLTVKYKSIDVGIIKLIPKEVRIDEVIVVDKIPILVQSGDTTIYNTDAFKVNKDAVAQDLLVKIPGIQVEDGKVKAQGEEVKKVLVDGKTFFGDDPNVALKNIPAEIIQQVQVFDQRSEQSQFTGFDDGNTSKAINIVTRNNIQNGTFGKLLAGYGSHNKCNVNGDLNLFNQEQRVSLIGQLNNTNEQNFSSLDLLGSMGDRQSGGGMGSMRGRESGGSGSGNNSQGSFVNSQGGDTKIKGFGINYNNKWEDESELGTSYFFNNTGNDLQSNLNRNYFASSDGGRNYFENNVSETKNTNHRVNIRFNYQLDSLNEIRFIPGFSIQKNTSSSLSDAFTNDGEFLINSTKNFTSSDLKGINLSSLLMYRHRFNSEGRSISLGFNTSYNKNDGIKKQFSENSYYSSIVQVDTVNQLSNILNKGLTFSSNLVYTEPINTYNFLMFNASQSVSNETNNKETFDYLAIEDSYSLLDTSLSNDYKKNYYTTALGAGYRYKKRKISLNASINYNISTLKSEQTYPEEYNIDKTFYSFITYIIFRYNISRDKNFNIYYRATTNAPSVSQLQNVLDNSNPLQLSIGNPDLRQEYGHSVTLRLSTINFSNMNTFLVMLNGSYKSNYIGTNTLIAKSDTTLSNGIFLNSGSQLSTPQNINGYITTQSFMTYGMPVDLISCNINLNLSLNYTRIPGLVNDVNNYSNSYSCGLGGVISSNVSTDIDFLISSTSYYNVIKNSYSKSNNQEYFSQQNNVRLYWMLFDEFVLQGNLSHKYDGGLSDNLNPNTFYLDLSFGVKLFSENRGEIKFSVYDVLNQNTNISRQTTDYYYQEYSTNVIGRYFLFSFIYNFREFS